MGTRSYKLILQPPERVSLVWDSALPKNNFNDLLPSDVVDGKGEGEGADKKTEVNSANKLRPWVK